MKTAIKNWRTTLAGNASGILLFLQSWLQHGRKLDYHDPALLVGLALALLGTIAGDGVREKIVAKPE
jgi:hypothetical protein